MAMHDDHLLQGLLIRLWQRPEVVAARGSSVTTLENLLKCA